MQASLERLNRKIERYEEGMMAAEKKLERMRREREEQEELEKCCPRRKTG